MIHGPDRGNYPNEYKFIKIEKPSLVAFKRHSKPHFQMVATFEEIAKNETQVIFKMLFDSPEECTYLKPFVVDKKEENFDRLEVELKKMQ